MGSNRFDVVPEYNYQPAPLDLLWKSGVYKQQKEDEGFKLAGELSGLAASLRPAPGHEQYAQDTAGRYTAQLKELIDKNPDFGSREFKRGAFSIFSQFGNDYDVKNIQNSRQAYDKQWSPIMNDPKNKSAIYNMPGVLDENNRFVPNKQTYDNLNYTPYADYDKHMDDYLKDVEYKVAKKSGYSIFSDKKTGLLMVSTSKGPVKVRELPEFQQAIEGLTETFMNPNKPESQYFAASTKKIYGEDAYNRDYTKEYITNRARRFFNTQDLSETDYGIIPGQFDKGSKDNQDKMITTSQTGALPTQVDTDIEDNLFNKSKFLSGVLQKPKAKQEEIATGEGIMYYKESQDDIDRKFNEQKAFLNNIRRNQPALNYKYIQKDGKYVISRASTEEEVLNDWKEARNDLKIRSNNKLNPSPDALDDLTKKVFGPEGVGDFENRYVTAIIDGQQVTGTSDVIAKALGYSDGVIPIDIRSKSRVIGINQMGSTPAEYVAKIADSDGKPVTITVNADNEVADMMRVSHSLIQIISKGESGKIHDSKSGMTFHVESKINPITKKFIPVIKMEDPQTGETEDIMLEQLLEKEKEDLLNSGYVGTVLGAQQNNRP